MGACWEKDLSLRGAGVGLADVELSGSYEYGRRYKLPVQRPPINIAQAVGTMITMPIVVLQQLSERRPPVGSVRRRTAWRLATRTVASKHPSMAKAIF